MRLYINENEIPLLKEALGNYALNDRISDEKAEKVCVLLERVTICERLQRNIKRGESK